MFQRQLSLEHYILLHAFGSIGVTNFGILIEAEFHDASSSSHYREKRAVSAADGAVKRWPNNTVHYRIDKKLCKSHPSPTSSFS